MQSRTQITACLTVLALGALIIAPILRAESSPIPARTTAPAPVPPAPDPVAPDPVAVAAPLAPVAKTADPVAPVRRDVDLVVIIDTSGSMEALLDSARSRLWDIVNDVGEREKNAHLRVAVLAYGTPGFGADKGYVRVLTDLSDDLDSVYAHAMSLTIDGGDEYVGFATHTALTGLSWSKRGDAARIVFVAGNEDANQGAQLHDFRTVCAEARERKIVMNALYAGPRAQGINEGWDQFAAACGGVYSNIDVQQGTVQVASPQDLQLEQLNQALNATYRAYGEQGASGSAAQTMADSSSSGMGGSTMSSRIASKASGLYDNRSWDLVDGVKSGAVDLGKLTDAELPVELRGKTPAERAAALAVIEAERTRIQAEILRLASERDAHLRGARSQGQESALDVATEAMLESQL